MGSKETSSPNAGPPNQGETTGYDQRLEKALTEFERDQEPPPMFELFLDLADLLPRLEQARVIPEVENPNPYNTAEQIEEHDQWWRDHPPEAETFIQQVKQRNQSLGILHIGTLIGRGPWHIP